MTLEIQNDWQRQLLKQLSNQIPYSLLEEEQLLDWLTNAKQILFKPGQKIIRPDELPKSLFLIIKGEIRLIALGDESEGSFTLDKKGPGQLIGWSGLLRAESTEHVIASTEVIAVALSGIEFVKYIKKTHHLHVILGHYQISRSPIVLQSQQLNFSQKDLLDGEGKSKNGLLTLGFTV